MTKAKATNDNRPKILARKLNQSEVAVAPQSKFGRLLFFHGFAGGLSETKLISLLLHISVRISFQPYSHCFCNHCKTVELLNYRHYRRTFIEIWSFVKIKRFCLHLLLWVYFLVFLEFFSVSFFYKMYKFRIYLNLTHQWGTVFIFLYEKYCFEIGHKIYCLSKIL